MADAEARIDAAKVSALKEVNAVAAETASEIVRRLIGIAPSAPEVASAVTAARKE
jgi:F-type H+-transporting ATPase subunit b